MKHGINVILILTLLTVTLCIVPNAYAQTQYYLTVTTDPTEVLTIDPEAVSGEGSYNSGNFAIVDAVQTVTSGPYHYEFTNWVGDESEEYLEYDEDNELTGNQAAYFMDGPRTAIAVYEQVNSLYHLILQSQPDYLAINDPSILDGEGWYSSGEVTFSAEPLVTDWDQMTRWEFNKWTTIYGEQISPENPATYFMDGDYTFVAKYDVQSYYLDVTTDPPEVLDIDPDAVWGADWYNSGTYGLVGAETTVTAEGYHYELVGWVGDDGYYDEEGDEIPLPPNQAGHFMDGPFTMVAVYELVSDVYYEKVFTDYDSQITIKISTDDNYFELSTPEKSYGPRLADRLVVSSNSLEILHSDSELNLVLYARTPIDFCLAYIKDKETGERFILRDKIGLE